MKFLKGEYAVDNIEHALLEGRVEALRQGINIKGTVFPTLVTTYGLKYNMYSGIFLSCLTLDDLFN